jgi:hypothetical protein
MIDAPRSLVAQLAARLDAACARRGQPSRAE